MRTSLLAEHVTLEECICGDLRMSWGGDSFPQRREYAFEWSHCGGYSLQDPQICHQWDL